MTAWVRVRSRLWECSSEQIRPATQSESLGADLIQTTSYRDVVEKQLSKRISGGALDVTREGPPPPEATLARKPRVSDFSATTAKLNGEKDPLSGEGETRTAF